MTTLTPGGIPFPDGTDYVVDGDNAIRAVAESVDARVLYGGFMRVRANVQQVGYTQSWLGIIFDQTADARPTVPFGFTYDVAKRAFVISKAGIYLIASTVTMTGGEYILRIRAKVVNVRTLAQITADSKSYTVSATAIGYLAAGTEVSSEVFSQVAYASQADSPDNPTSMSITHLPQIP